MDVKVTKLTQAFWFWPLNLKKVSLFLFSIRKRYHSKSLCWCVVVVVIRKTFEEIFSSAFLSLNHLKERKKRLQTSWNFIQQLPTFLSVAFFLEFLRIHFFAAALVVVVAVVVVVVVVFTKPREQSEIKHKDFSEISLALLLFAQEKQAKTLRLNKISKRIT